MTAESIFLSINIIATIGWLSLIVLSPFWKSVDQFLIGVIIALLCAAYSVLNLGHIADVGGPISFLSFEGVSLVFSNPYLINAGWAHIIAFDLMVGIWIKNNAKQNGFRYWFVVLVLLVTVVLGPLGLLLYQLSRWAKTQEYFTDFFQEEYK